MTASTSANKNSSLPQAADTKEMYVFPYLESGGLYVRSTAKVIYGREKLRKKEKPVSLACGLLLGITIVLVACCSVKRKNKRIVTQRPLNTDLHGIVTQRPLNTELYGNFDNCIIELRRVHPPESSAHREEPRVVRKPQGRITKKREQLNKMTQTWITRPYSFVKFTTKDISTQTCCNESEGGGDLSNSHQQGNTLLQNILQHSRVIYGIQKMSEDEGVIIPIIDDQSFDNYIKGLKQQQFMESLQPTSSSTSSYVLPEVLNTLKKPPQKTESEGEVSEDENYVNTSTLRKKNEGKVASNTEEHTYVNCDRTGSLYTRGNPPNILDVMHITFPKTLETESHFILLKLTEELLTLLYPEQDEEYMSMDGKKRCL